MKKLVALALVLVLALTLCASAFADYYPTATFTSAAKNRLVKYGNSITWKIKCNCGSFSKVLNVYNQYIYRANYDLYVKKSSKSYKVADVNYSGSGYDTVTCYTSSTSKVIKRPSSGKCNEYKVVLTSWYKPISNGYVQSYWSKAKAVSTKLYIMR